MRGTAFEEAFSVRRKVKKRGKLSDSVRTGEINLQTDLFGKMRYRINLHMHTTLSDGVMSPAEAAQRYREAGYDAIAITDHWSFGEADELGDMLILSGAEYNINDSNTRDGLFHIVGVGMHTAPELRADADAQTAINAIRKAGGLVILAHPAWSLNSPAQILPLKGVDVLEIYNSVSGVHMSRRPDSGLIVDMLGAQGRFYPLIADDDTHYYDGDDRMSWIMAEASDCTRESLLRAIRNGHFYATQGPEVHLLRDGDEFIVRCSPCREIVFLSDCVWSPRCFAGNGLTEARYKPRPEETFIRAEVTDENGRRAWTNCVVI